MNDHDDIPTAQAVPNPEPESGIDTIRIALEEEIAVVVTELRTILTDWPAMLDAKRQNQHRHRLARLLSRVATAQETLCILRPTAPPPEGGAT